MTGSASSLLAVLLGLGVFAVIVAVGWRSVQHRRILRLRDADGHETIIIAGEDDDISSVVTSTAEPPQTAPAPAAGVVDAAAGDPEPLPEFGRRRPESETRVEGEAGTATPDRLGRVVRSTK